MLFKESIFNKDLKNLFKHSKNYLGAEFITVLVGLISLPIFTRILSTEEFGIMSIFLSMVTLLSVFLGLGFRGAIVRYFYEDKKDFFQFFSSNTIFLFLFGILFLFLLNNFKNYLSDLIKIPVYFIQQGFIISFLLVIIFQFQAYLQASQKSKFLSVLKILNTVLAIGISTGLMYYMQSDKYFGRSYGMMVSALIVISIISFKLFSILSFSFKKTHLIYALSFGIPVVLHLISQNILTSFDQFMINNILGISETGIYSIGYRIGMLQNLITSAILTAWTPVFYDKIKSKSFDKINELTKKVVIFLSIFSICLIVLSNDLLLLITGDKYLGADIVLSLTIISYFFYFTYSIFVAYSFYEKKTKLITFYSIIVALFNIVLNYFLIPKLGINGAAITTLISYILLFLLHYLRVQRKWQKNQFLNINYFIKPILFIAFAFLSTFILRYFDFKIILVLFIKVVLIISFSIRLSSSLFYRK